MVRGLDHSFCTYSLVLSAIKKVGHFSIGRFSSIFKKGGCIVVWTHMKLELGCALVLFEPIIGDDKEQTTMA